MNSFDKTLYLCELFEKNAQAVKIPYQFNYDQDELRNTQYNFLFLFGKEVSLENIDYWLTQNENIIEQYHISMRYMLADSYLHVLMESRMVNKKENCTVISTTNDFDNNIEYEIINQGFLKGYKDIPNLYIYTAIDSGFNTEPLSKTLVPFAFIQKTLEEKSNINPNDITELFPSFIEQNKPKLLKIMSLFNYAPKYIGGGEDGSAFDIGPNLILKIFTETFSYNKAKESYDRLHKNPELGKNEANIYDVGILGQFGNLTLYYYIMEKMTPIDDYNIRYPMNKIVGYVGQYIKKFQSDINKYKKSQHDDKTIKNFLNTLSDKLEKELYLKHSKEIYQIETDVENLNKDWVKSLCEEILFKYITNRADLHLGNLGVTNYGKFVYFDPSHSYWENNADIVNTPSRDSIAFQDQSGGDETN